MKTFFPFLPSSISQLDSNGYKLADYDLFGTSGVYKRCIESFTPVSAVSRNLIPLPNGAKYDPNQTYDAPVTLGQFDITWTVTASLPASVNDARGYFLSEMGLLNYIPYSRVRIIAGDGSAMWYLDTRGIRVQASINGGTPRIMRVVATFDPIVNEWAEGGTVSLS